MRLGIKAKQVAGVTILVGFAVVLLSAWYLSELARLRLEDTNARARAIAQTISQRAFDAIAAGVAPRTVVQTDPGLQSILTASLLLEDVQYAAIVDVNNVVIAHSLPGMVGQTLAPAESLSALLSQGWMSQMRAIYAAGGQTYEFAQGLSLAAPGGDGATELGSIHVGVSTLLIRPALEESLKTPLYTSFGVVVIASVVAMLLAQVVLRPIHVIRSGLQRLGRGELDVKVDLPREAELDDLGDSFKAVSARLAADQHQLAGQKATLESVVEHLEDAVALFAPDGTLLFANPAMRAGFRPDAGQRLHDLLPPDHPYRALVERTLSSRQAQGPDHVWIPEAGERLAVTHVVESPGGASLGVMLVSRNLAYLSEVESTLSYSRKLAALGRLSAGIAHEVKNPLNATMIHLELLKMQVQNEPQAMEHLEVIAAQVRRLDEVVQGFLKFTRPEDLELRPTPLAPLVQEIMPVIAAEASKSHVDVQVDLPASLPAVSADHSMLQQAFLNLALNACQAMPHGGRLRISAAARPARRIDVVFEDTGVGIAPEHLEKIFNLYFTTRERGTGIGLSMVYRTIQLHDGDIEVESVVGKGTKFKVTLRQA